MNAGVVQLRRVVMASERYRSAADQAFGLGLTESQALSQLATHGDLSPGELGRSLGLSSGSMTNLLDRLETSGLVQRQRHPEDRRRLIVSLTERSRAIVEHSNGFIADMVQRLQTRSPEEDVSDWLATLADALLEASEQIVRSGYDAGPQPGHRGRPSAHRAAQSRGSGR